jgi:Rrf2 family nitric oxide-sensitive transcriptional repressor
MYLARGPREVPAITIAEVSNQFNIPRNHLIKVAGKLAKHGWIDATRGRVGGIRLSADPSTLRLGQVVRALEDRKELIECEKLACRLSNDCKFRFALGKAHDAFYAALDEYTLADITGGFVGNEISQMHKGFLTAHLEKSVALTPI